MSEMPLTVTQQADQLRNFYKSRPAGFFKAVRKLYLPLQEGKATEKTFFDYTLVIFEETEKPDREPDFGSPSGSCYWYSPEGVVRKSDHWGNGVAKCNWAIKLKNGRTVYGTTSRDVKCYKEPKYGFARWDDFVHIPRILEINGQEVMTTFNNYIPRDKVVVDGKVYKKVVIEYWEPETE